MPQPMMRPSVREDSGDYRPLDTLECTVERVTFHNEENGYSVLKVLPVDVRDKVKADVIPVIGNFSNPVVGESLRLHGRWDKHPQHGKQFRAEKYEILRPATAAAIEKYLGSGMIKGIGPKTAQLLVKKYGKDTLEVIENKPEKLVDVKGIGEKKALLIQQAYTAQKEIAEIMKFLVGHGITPTYAVKIYRYYKERAIEQVEKNPYQLATDIWGIGFKSADKIARDLGVAPDAPQRLEAGLVYVLNQEMEGGGHCYLPQNKLLETAAANLYLKSAEDLPEFEQAREKAQLAAKLEPTLADLIARGMLVAETIELLGHEEVAIYTPSFHATEKAVAERVNQLINSPWRNRPKPAEIDKIIEGLPGHEKLSEEQEMAVRRALSESLLILTGGPGCGKCVVGDTLVLGTNGFTTMRSHWGDVPEIADSFREYQTEVVSKDGIASTSHAYCGGVRETRRVKTHLGLELEGTPNHRIWAMTEHGPDWKQLGELQPGDRVAVRRGDNVWGDNELPSEIGYLLGVLMGDGGLTMPRTVIITNNNLDLLTRCNRIFQDYFSHCGKIRSTRKTFELRVHGIALWAHLERLGVVRGKSEEKRVPHCVFSASREFVRQFLAGLIDTDGHIQVRPGNQPVFEITLKSLHLIHGMQLLLLNLGIVGRVAPKFVKYRYAERPVEERIYFRYQVSGADADLLMKLVPTSKAFPITERAYNTNNDIVPLPGSIIRRIFTQPGERTRREWWAWKREIKGERLPTRGRLLGLLDSITVEDGIEVDIAMLREACRPECFWDRIASVEESEAPVYDLTVPGPHSFVANGFINHNTFTTNFVVQALEKLGKRIQIAAPTGRAAKRAAEVSGREAKTIHRMLAFDPEKKGFKHGPGEPLELDVLVIDESSMLDLMLTHNTLRAVPDGAQIIFVGDVDQLPSVGPGNVLKDLIESGRVPVARLTQVFRQAAASKIITNAHSINKGKLPQLLPPSEAKNGADCVFVEVEETEEMLGKIKGIVAKSLPNLGFKAEDITVLSPMQRGVVGVRNLNDELQKVVNPPAPTKTEHQRGGTVFRVGDRVMQRRNNYDKNVFNGDVGYINNIDGEEQVVVIDYPEGPVEYDFSETDELMHAFSVTTHKCLHHDERVRTDRGLIPIRDIQPGDWVQTGLGPKRQVRARFETGERPVVQVRTRSGQTLRVSAEHPLWAIGAGESLPQWHAAGALQAGDILALDRSFGNQEEEPILPTVQPLAGRPNAALPHTPERMNPELAYLLGVIVGDGSYRDTVDGTVDVTNEDAEVLQRLEQGFSDFGLRVCRYQPKRNKAARLYVISRAFRKWLLELGLEYSLATVKRVPEVVFRSSSRSQAAFLQGLFDTDGSAGQGSNRSVRLVTASLGLAEDVQQLLLSLGMISHRRCTVNAATIEVSGPSLRRFAETIGFSISRKQTRLEALLLAQGRQGQRRAGKTNCDVIPFGTLLAEQLWESLAGLQGAEVRRVKAALSAVRHGRVRLSYTHLADTIAILEHEGRPVPPLACETQTRHFYFDPIVAVEATGESAPMVDIEVEGIHSFVSASGMVCHNSQGSEYPACVIIVHTTHFMMLQRNLVYTALTRAKKFAVIVGTNKAMGIAVRNRHVELRFTRLAQRLQNLVEGLGHGRLAGGKSGDKPAELPTPPMPGRLF